MSIPPFDPDDPRLTAYALGEANKNDRQAIQKLLAESAEARAEVEQMRALARALTTSYEREQEQYLGVPPTSAVPSNVVAFRDPQPRRGQAAILALKVAAVVALMASLAYLTVRRSRPPGPEGTASAPATAATPPMLAANPLPVAAKTTSEGEGTPVPGRARTASDQAEAPPAVPIEPQRTGTDILVAQDRPRSVEPVMGQASGRVPSGLSPLSATAPPAAPKPGAVAQTAAASIADRPAESRLSDEQVARTVVRIRSSNGVFFGGVIVSPGGLILCITSDASNALRGPFTALLSDNHEFSVTPEPMRSNPGWRLLRIEASALPPATLAASIPSGEETLAVPQVDPQSGALTFIHGGSASLLGALPQECSRRIDDQAEDRDAGFAFNSSGALLLVDSTSTERRVFSRAKAADDHSPSAPARIRPFTAAEREIIQQAIKRH